MEKPKIIVFDVDDVMWDLNLRVSRILDIPYEKFTCFAAYENPNFTREESEAVVKAYTDPDTYRDIVFRQPVIDLINELHRNYPKCAVHIISNNSNQEIADVKKEQLAPLLVLPEYKLHFKVIDIRTQTKTKKLPDGMFLFVDDSPHNIIIADAEHKIMPARPHNDVLKDGKLEGYKVDRPITDYDLVNTVMKYVVGADDELVYKVTESIMGGVVSGK